MSNVSFSDDQFRDLLGVLASRNDQVPQKSGSFASCTARFNGSRNTAVVEAFLSTISTYKKIEAISNDNAIEGLTLLLVDEASIWWLGVKDTVTIWQEAVSLIRTTFAPKRPAYLVYDEIVCDKQQSPEGTELFVAKKRALMAELPKPSLTPSQGLDLLYTSLHINIRDRIPRDSVATFDEFLSKVRQIEESVAARAGPNSSNTFATQSGKRPRCTFCRAFGHNEQECRKKADKGKTTTTGGARITAASTPKPSHKITCYGCGEPGVVRSKCPKCNRNQVGAVDVGFYSLNPTVASTARLRPTVKIGIAGVSGQAHIDSGAKLSVASTSLYGMLQRKGVQFKTENATITLADGLRRRQFVQTAAVLVTLCGRTIPTNFIVLPESHDNRTLLGVDFIQDAGIVLNLPQLLFHFLDEPGKKYELYNEEEVDASVSTVQTELVKTESVISRLAKITSLEPMLSPLPMTPSPTSHVPEECNMADSYGPPPLIEFNTPPQSPSRPEPELSGYSPRFVGTLFRDAQTIINGTEVTLSPHSQQLFGPNIDISMVAVSDSGALTTEESIQLNTVLDRHSAVFIGNGEPASLVEHSIETGNHKPIAVPPYRLSPQRKEILRKEVNQMLEEGIITPSKSPWAAPVVMVPKKNGDVRVCIDYRQLNSITVADAYPLPRIDDLLHEAKPTPYMSSLDLRAGYWQIKVRNEDQGKTAFVTPFGLYQFMRMPFGLRNAPATFQRFIDRLRLQLDGVKLLAYLDDLILLSPSFEQHLEDLVRLFQLLQENNVVINRQKCRFCQDQIPYLGHIITKTGLCTDPAKISAILDMPAPQNVRQVQSFLQTCSWYRRFVPHFAKITQPLTRLTKKDASWEWGTSQKDAFSELKRCLTSAPILCQADLSKPYIIKTDASDYAIGAVLVQGEGTTEHPVEYASRLLTKAERNYSTTEREALAVIWAVSKFRGYIEGSSVVIATDHQALKWLMSIKSPTGRLARWALQLQPYNLSMEYIPGKTNVIADNLSRPSCPELQENCGVCIVSIDMPRRSAAEIRQEQLKDKYLKAVIDALEKPVQDEDAVYWANKGYIMNNGLLHRYIQDSDNDSAQLVIPQHERSTILSQYHDDPTAGHYGADKTFRRIAARYYWKGMRKEIEHYVQDCIKCQRYKPSNLKPAGLLQTTAINQRWETLSFDLFGPLPPTSDNKTWIFIVEDVATRWVELFALEQATAEACATVLLNEVFLRYGVPRRLISDNGTQFVSSVMQKLAYCLHIQHAFTPVYHPEANPVERKNRDLKTQLAILVEGDHRTWAERLPSIRYAMNTSNCLSTGHTPAYLSFGRELRTYDDVKHDLRQIVLSENFIPEITPKLILLADTLQRAREVQEYKEETRKKWMDERRRPAPAYQPGDLVLVATNVLSNAARYHTAKLAPRRDGPYIVLRRHGPCSYEVAHPADQKTPLGIYHSSALSPYQGSALSLPDPERPLRRRGRPRKQQTATATSTGLLAGATSGPEGETVTRRTHRRVTATRAQLDRLTESSPPPRTTRPRRGRDLL